MIMGADKSQDLQGKSKSWRPGQPMVQLQSEDQQLKTQEEDVLVHV